MAVLLDQREICCTICLYFIELEVIMPIQTSYSEIRAKLAKFLDIVIDDNEVVIIKRRHREPVALIAESELRGLEETAHLIRSPKNAERLLKALEAARRGHGKPSSVTELRQRLGIGNDK